MSSFKGRIERRTKTKKHGYVKTMDGDDKFIGGAAVARMNAVRKGRGNRILRPGEVEKSKQIVSSSLSRFERFFAALLQGEATDFLHSDGTKTWTSICKRLSLPFPTQPLKHCYNDQRQHFEYRAALVMEEARYAVSEGLKNFQLKSFQLNKFKRSQKKRNRHRDHEERGPKSNSMLLSLTGVEVKEKHGFCTMTFSKDHGFTSDEIQNLRQGTVFACVSQNLAPTVANSVLGCILASNRDAMIESNSFAIVVFKAVNRSQESPWWVAPVASLLTEQRKFEACANGNTHKIPFLRPLLGLQKPTHIKFTEDDNGELLAEEVERQRDGQSLFSHGELGKSGFRLPTLNSTQEKAAITFLNSQPNTITLIQGPPGTGKTTLLVSIIFHYLMQSIEGDKARCLMVCAPTNKAVSVLCSRFLDAFENKQQLPCNVLLVGDDDKLLDDERSRKPGGDKKSPLRAIFLYTWIKTVLDRLTEISKFLARPTKDVKESLRIVSLAKRLLMQLRQSLSRFPHDLGNALDRVVELVEEGIEVGHRNQKEALNTIEAMKCEISDWKQELIWQDLLSSAHIIFCTLASSGAGILKRSIGEVDDLIVDEAAASCEPEMYIPFHYRPQRLLAVGDPKQLPATVMSNVAASRGLSKSLHERLMYDAGHPHIMLDIQYRMNPAISQFPSRYFYDGKVRDGHNVVSDQYTSDLLLNGDSLVFLQVNGIERQSRLGSFENHAEAQAVVKLVQSASRRLRGQWQSADRIRIITFYNAQAALIKNCLRRYGMQEVVVATVDSSQGSEADIVIVSLVRSHGNSKYSSVGFLSDDRRMNVAITRAKYQLICVGNTERMAALTSSKAKTVRALASDAIKRNCLLHSMHDRSRNKRHHADSDCKGTEKRSRWGENRPASSDACPGVDTKVNNLNLYHNGREDREQRGGVGKQGKSQGNPKMAVKTESSILQVSERRQATSATVAVVALFPNSSNSSSSSSSSGSDSSVSDLSEQYEMASAVRSWNVHPPPRSMEKGRARSEDGGSNDPSECSARNNLVDADGIGLKNPTTGTAMVQNTKGSSFPSGEKGSPIQYSGRPEIPLKLYTSMVMSDDSASYGDNGSELEWNAGENVSNAELDEPA